jgi:hypothetical protein
MNEKDSPWSTAITTVGLSSCFAKAREVADAQLNAAYKEIRGKLDAAGEKRLVATQRFWTQYRDANYTAERQLYARHGTDSRTLRVLGGDDAGAYERTGGHVCRQVEVIDRGGCVQYCRLRQLDAARPSSCE